MFGGPPVIWANMMKVKNGDGRKKKSKLKMLDQCMDVMWPVASVAYQVILEPMLRAFFASSACFARNELSSKRVGAVGLSQKPPKLRSWRCTQPIAAKATAGEAVVGKISSISPTAAVV